MCVPCEIRKGREHISNPFLHIHHHSKSRIILNQYGQACSRARLRVFIASCRYFININQMKELILYMWTYQWNQESFFPTHSNSDVFVCCPLETRFGTLVMVLDLFLTGAQFFLFCFTETLQTTQFELRFPCIQHDEQARKGFLSWNPVSRVFVQ